MSSVSVELIAFSFCLVDAVYTAPFPRVQHAPVCPRMLVCEPYEPSINQYISLRLTADKIKCNSCVPLKYRITLDSFL